MVAEKAHSVAVVCGRPPAFGRADVLRYIDGCFDCRNKRVLHATQPDGVATPGVISGGLPPEHCYVLRHATEQPQDAALIYHRSSPSTGEAGCELPMGTGDPRQLIEVDLPGGGLPPDPGHRIGIEEQLAADRNAARQLKRSAVQDEEVHLRREQDGKGLRGITAEIRRHVDVGFRAVSPAGPAPVEEGKARAGLLEYRRRFRNRRSRRCLIHKASFADRPSITAKAAEGVGDADGFRARRGWVRGPGRRGARGRTGVPRRSGWPPGPGRPGSSGHRPGTAGSGPPPGRSP